MAIIRLYRKPGLSQGATEVKLKKLKKISPELISVSTELCFNVEISKTLQKEQIKQLQWILASPFYLEDLSSQPHLSSAPNCFLVEIGPRLNFSTAFSSNAVSICHSVGLTQVSRLEVSTRFLLEWTHPKPMLGEELQEKLVSALHDRMTQCRYNHPIESFNLGIVPQPWFEVDIMGKGRKALEEVNANLGLAFDDWDLDFYTNMFKNKLKRNPTSVECFDLAQSNSEHSRHWFFKGQMIIDGKEQKESLIDMIINTQKNTNPNNVIKFSDNSSAIEGFKVKMLRPSKAGVPCAFEEQMLKEHLIFTAETHNFPTGVAPFSGATTGTGGRIRDVHAVGRGGHYIAGTAGYSFGNLQIPGYNLPWEDSTLVYPGNFAPPLEVAIEASNGASDYGNKFGEPVVSGFSRSFGMVLPSGERREWIKPIMFSGGVGALDAPMVNKLPPEIGMQLVKIGGPVYRIGVGGGSASSVEVQGDNKCELDFGAVQRGDAEMEQKLHRVIRACLELGDANPICSIHDQGAGGNGNVLKELVEPAGAVVFTKRFQLGDPTLNTLEIWGAEYQENDALLCRSQDAPLLAKIAARERCPVNFVGVVTGSGKIVLSEEDNPNEDKWLNNLNDKTVKHPVDLDLELVLGKMPNKVFRLDRGVGIRKSLSLPADLSVRLALERVLRLPSVASKRFLTTKVDRCVTGLVAQQQCVGPLHQPLADPAVLALSQFSTEGIATAIGEQPIKGLVDPAAGARMTVAESLSNLVFALISDIKDVKCSGNWMWAAKLPGEGAALFEACKAMCSMMGQLGIAVDGGKDSLSMAARVSGETVKAPGTLVVSTYAPCPNIHHIATPALKGPSHSKSTVLMLVDLSCGKCRLGGSALAQCFSQLGDSVPDVDKPNILGSAFCTTQNLLAANKVLSGHDVSDGGLVTCLLEMAFAGNCGLLVDIPSRPGVSAVEQLFSEELAWVLEVEERNMKEVEGTFSAAGVTCIPIGRPGDFGPQSKICMKVGSSVVLESSMLDLFLIWEETSHQLELLQANPECAISEHKSWATRKAPKYRLSFDPRKLPKPSSPLPSYSPVVAVIREEGINGDREMSASLHMAGFAVWDVTMQDLLDGKITADYFQGIIFPGGFSYADVLGSAKGWAASLLFHPNLCKQFKAFAEQPDTFSLGVCNGCQLACLLGWVGQSSTESSKDVDEWPTPPVTLDHNASERFECRFSTVGIYPSPSLMLKGMEGSVLGVWVAHGEGRFTFRNDDVYKSLEQSGCIAIRYVDDAGEPTVQYPQNPNGSRGGMAGICSADGRHLAMMPHPERCTLLWQWPWLPASWSGDCAMPCNPMDPSPWLRMFQNAYSWCMEHPRH
ncbi:phosphoribosylformylglycinamidine synthase [Ischnura elegans]|uniref:phosphoribosylformylglycinamidine synthase n=1 Tax=Ischnura elegans TaxID=197161 RepID=UPI001ED871F2|nr:phosphoribosylformylglycinamidine synthase [Ischnura elegans]XP_046394023.1 phosphoribosylformylglycinamidine synthase [Ischnura elegans]XP_046394024.1 phosphoribosylformylglycinamidine synthase [Ischnura elegans]XP_046394025.1 phosphoribosylformylglycinamidine synthase [Ischnura elegans]